ncbi:amidohydrolase [Lentibacillus salicampi]|uniref:Amidohydrolase n=2 Tax=Lentibacillus salicampi TaxID=175306 RepID=A0A4Y9AAU8_9BACI|nr:amidohydrolase [Lentibacillus salicampi]
MVIVSIIMAIGCEAGNQETINENNELAETVYVNGTIYTVDQDFSKVSAMAIKDRKLVYVGNDKDAENYIGPETEVIDLKNKTVIPGLNDGHIHFTSLGTKLLEIDAFNKPKQEILELVKKEAKALDSEEWILGRGWNHELWPDESFPTRDELDQVAPDNPVALTRVDGHSVWVNSKALEIGGITKETPNPEGGEIIRDENGEATGVLVDAARQSVTEKIPPYSEERLAEAQLEAQDTLLSNGITSTSDAGANLEEINIMKELYKENDLKVRLNVMIDNTFSELGETFKHYLNKGPEIGLFDNRLTIGSVKLMADGALGSRSAALLDGYSDRSGHKGNYIYSDEQIYFLVKKAREQGFQVATHAIGDGANQQVIDTYEKVLNENPLEDHRWRIEHYQISNASQIEKIAELGIIPSMQPTHATSDKNMAEDRLGAERIKYSYAWRKIIDSGSHIIGGSDAPVELVNPFHGIYAAVTRMDRDGNPHGGWYPEEKMTREEAIRAFTIWAAEGSLEEDLKGSLEKGKLADFLVIDQDIMEIPEEQLKDITVLATVVGGNVVYEN